MACDLYLAPSFPQLEKQLLERLRRPAASPLAPRWVAVPTSTLARHLRRRAATLAGEQALAGVRIVPIEILIDRLRTRLAPGSARWEPLLDLLLQEAAGRIPSSSPLGELADEPAAFDLLRPTFKDLADAGFGPDSLELLSDLADEAELRPLEADVLRIFAGWVVLLEEAGVRWQPIADQRLTGWIERVDRADLHSSLGAEAGGDVEVLVHGFYELTDVNTGIVCALASRLQVSLFFPDCGTTAAHPAFEFSRSYLDELRLRLGPALADTAESAADTETARFFVSTFPDGSAGNRPDWLTLQAACGRRAEVVAAAARVRQWLDDPSAGIAAEDVLVTVPDPESYVDVIRDVFGQFAIPVELVDVSDALAPPVRPLRLLIRFWEQRAPAELLLAYLREAPEVLAARDIDPDHFEAEFRRSGCWGGSSLQALIEMSRQGVGALTPAEAAFLEAVVRMWVDPPAGPRSIDRWVGWIEELCRDWLPDPAPLQPLVDGLRKAAKLRPGLDLHAGTVLRLLTAAGSAGPLTDPHRGGGVRVVPVMRARGLTGRAMVLLGLAAGTFPIQLEEDPLLSDESRRSLRKASSQAGHRLALASALNDEMALLFVLLNTSVDRIHWIIPETDELGKSVSPTPWVQRYQQAWAGEAVLRMPRGPRQQAAVLARLADDGGLLPPSLGFLLDNRLAEMVGDAAHYAHVGRTRPLQESEPDWQGFVRAPGWKPTLPDPEDPARISVTGLESLARCPYRFYAGQVAGWAPLEPARFTPALRPLDWGSLVHRFLEAVLNPVVGTSKTLGDRAAELLADNGATLRRLTHQLPPRLSAAFRFLPPVIGNATRWRLFRLVSSYLEAVGGSCADGRIETQELKRRRPFPGLEPLLISGVVDRVDVDDGGFRTVVDYKSGRPPWSSDRRRKREVALGFFMQPWLYPWLLAADFGSQPLADFRYVYLGGEEPVEVAVRPQEAAERLLQPLGRIVQGGFFFPTSNETLSRTLGESVEPCLYCALPSVCRRFEGRRTREAMRRLLEWVPERFDAGGGS